MTNSDHEEADTRIMLHVYDSLASGSRKIMIRTVDTDVVVILIGEFHNMVNDYPNIGGGRSSILGGGGGGLSVIKV